jgi:hypothetical protein
MRITRRLAAALVCTAGVLSVITGLLECTGGLAQLV